MKKKSMPREMFGRSLFNGIQEGNGMSEFSRSSIIIHLAKVNHYCWVSCNLVDILFAWLWYMYSVICILFSHIKLSSPNLNNMIILGCVLIYVSVYMVAIDGKRVDETSLAGLCMVRLPRQFTFKQFRVNSYVWIRKLSPQLFAVWRSLLIAISQAAVAENGMFRNYSEKGSRKNVFSIPRFL